GAGFAAGDFERGFAVENAELFAQPMIGLGGIAENIFRQGLDAREPHDAIGFFKRERLALGLAVAERARRNDVTRDLPLREAGASDMAQHTDAQAAMHEAGEVAFRGNLGAERLPAAELGE